MIAHLSIPHQLQLSQVFQSAPQLPSRPSTNNIQFYQSSLIIMQFSTIAIAFLASAVHALPQSGSPFFAVGNKYSGGGCTDSTLIFADPVFSPEGLCQPLNRSPGQNVVSYKRIDSITRCNGKSGSRHFEGN